MTGLTSCVYMSPAAMRQGAGRIELTSLREPIPTWPGQVQKQASACHGELAPRWSKTPGVKVSKSTRNWLIIVGLTSDDDSLDEFDLSDLCSVQHPAGLGAGCRGSEKLKPSDPNMPCGFG